MTDIGDCQLRKGQSVWVIDERGSSRAAEYVGEAGASIWLGGKTRAIVVYVDTRTGEAVEADRVIPRTVQ